MSNTFIRLEKRVMAQQMIRALRCLLHTRQRAALGIEIFDAVGILAGHAHRRMRVVAHIAYIPCSVGFIRRQFQAYP